MLYLFWIDYSNCKQILTKFYPSCMLFILYPNLPQLKVVLGQAVEVPLEENDWQPHIAPTFNLGDVIKSETDTYWLTISKILMLNMCIFAREIGFDLGIENLDLKFRL